MRPLLLAAFLPVCAAPALAAGDPYRAAAVELAGRLPEGARVCVLPFDYIGAEGARGGAVVAERLDAELVKDGRLKVLARARVAEALAGLRAVPGGDERAKKAGAILGAAYAVTGTLIRKPSGRLELNARAVDPATGEVKAAVRAAVREDWLEKFPDAPAGAAGAAAYALCKDGMYALDARRFEEADGLFTKAIAAEKDAACGMGIPGMALMARSIARQGRRPDDIPEDEGGPPTDFTLKEQARIRKAAGENARRLARYDALLRAMPDNAEAYYERGKLYVKLGRYREAVKDLGAAIRLEPGQAKYYHARGFALARQSLLDNALKDFDEAVRLSPRFAKAYGARGTIYSITEQCGRALGEFAKASEYDPADPIPLVNGADCLCRLERYPEALAQADKAVALEADLAEAHYWRGAALTELKRYDEAVKALDRALELAPGFALAGEKRREALDRKSGRYESYAGDKDRAMKLFNARETD